MTPEKFDAENWIKRLAATLPELARVQEPYLEDYWRCHPRTHRIVDGKDVAPFPLEDVQTLYESLRHGRRFGKETHYDRLRTALDVVRQLLLGHPVLERVAVTGRIIGDNYFWMQLPNSGYSISAGHLIAGLMARAAELSGDGFRIAVPELNALLSPAGDEDTPRVLGDLDEGCDAKLFFGLTVVRRIDICKHMAILPYSDLFRFVDEKFVRELAPRGAGFHDWQGVGAIVRPFRWRPAFRRRGNVNASLSLPEPFFPDAAAFLDLLAVSHATPVAPLAKLSGRIDRSACLLLGMDKQSPGIYRSWLAQGVDGFAECPVLCPAAFKDAQVVFENRESVRYRKLKHIVDRLAQALARDGRFAIRDKVVDVSIALEGMYDLPRWGVTNALAEQVAGFLGTDARSRDHIGKNVRAFYDARSAIVHNRSGEATPFTNGAAFVTGFDLARRSLFKMLRKGGSNDWNSLKVGGF